MDGGDFLMNPKHTDELDPQILEQIEESFRSGCSVAALLNQIRELLPNPKAQRGEIARYLRAALKSPSAIRVPYVSSSTLDSEVRSDSARLNWVFLCELVREYSEANQNAESRSDSAWFAGITLSSSDQRHALLEQNRCDLSESGWIALSEADRNTIKATASSWLMLCEDVQLLAALVETLQDQVRELQGNKQPATV
jgi:hypothetical protein